MKVTKLIDHKKAEIDYGARYMENRFKVVSLAHLERISKKTRWDKSYGSDVQVRYQNRWWDAKVRGVYDDEIDLVFCGYRSEGMYTYSLHRVRAKKDTKLAKLLGDLGRKSPKVKKLHKKKPAALPIIVPSYEPSPVPKTPEIPPEGAIVVGERVSIRIGGKSLTGVVMRLCEYQGEMDVVTDEGIFTVPATRTPSI